MHSIPPEAEVTVEDFPATTRVIRLPEFLASIILNQPDGATVGKLIDKSNESILIPSDRVTRIKQLKAPRNDAPPQELLFATNEHDIDEGLVCEPSNKYLVLGPVSETQTFMPSLTDPVYRQYLASSALSTTTQQKAAQVNKIECIESGAALREKVQVGRDESQLFRYFSNKDEEEEGVGVNRHGASLSAMSTEEGSVDFASPMRAKRPHGQIRMEDAQASIFQAFEEHQGEGLTLKELQSAVSLPPPMLRQVLDRIAEPQRERLNKRTVFVLKAEFIWAQLFVVTGMATPGRIVTPLFWGCTLVRKQGTDQYETLKEILAEHADDESDGVGSVSSDETRHIRKISESFFAKKRSLPTKPKGDAEPLIRRHWGNSDCYATFLGMLSLQLTALLANLAFVIWGIFYAVFNYREPRAWTWRNVGDFSFGCYLVIYAAIGAFAAPLLNMRAIRIYRILSQVFATALMVNFIADVISWLIGIIYNPSAAGTSVIALILADLLSVVAFLFLLVFYQGVLNSLTAVIVVSGTGWERKTWFEIMLESSLESAHGTDS